MCNLLPWRFVCSVTVILGIITFLFMLFIYPADPQPEWGLITKAAGITAFIMGAFVQLNLWRVIWAVLPILNRKVFPDIHGMYEGTLKSDYNGGTTVNNVSVTIRQRLTGITVILKTDDMTSISTIAQIVAQDIGVKAFQLFYLYQGISRNNIRVAQPPHSGGGELDIKLGKVLELTGRYFNDPSRATSGEITLVRKSKEIS